MILNFNKTVAKLIGLILACMLLFSAWTIWRNTHLAEQVRLGQFQMGSNEALSSLPPLITEPLRQTLFQESSMASIDLDITLKIADEYVARRPLDPQGWLWRSLFHQRADDLVSSQQDLATAHLLSGNNTPVLVSVFNRYVELGLVQSAMAVGADLSIAQPERFRSVFYLMTRLNDDYAEVVNKVIPRTMPKNRPGRDPYDSSLYYRWAINDAIRADNAELAAAVWQVAPQELRRSSDYGLRYLDYLSRNQQADQFSRVWFDHSNETLTAGIMPLQKTSEENSACWRLVPLKNEAAETTSFTDEGESGLLIKFLGVENLDYYHATCTFLVKPNRKYSLSGRWMGQDITTLAGPFMDVYAPSVEKSSKRSEPRVGSWPWTDFELDFETKVGGDIMILRVRRVKTSYLDSKISGSVRIKNIKLTEVGMSNETDPASSVHLNTKVVD